MAQLTEFTRDTLIGIHVTLFNAVPGAERLAWMLQRYGAGMSEVEIADALVSTYPEDFAAVTPPDMSGLVVGSLLADRLLDVFGKLVPVDAWLWAQQWLSNTFDAGASYPEVLVEAVNALRATTDPAFSLAKALLENRIAIAKHVAIDLRQNPVNLIEAQDFIAFVDHLPGSINIAKQYLAARQGAGAPLSSGADILSATVFNAFPEYGPGTDGHTNTLQTGDVLTGLGSSATLNAAISTRASTPHFVPVFHNISVLNLWVTGDQMLSMDMQQASGLWRKLTINSHVRVDLHGLRTDGKADGSYLEIDASGVSGELLLFIDAPLDASQLNSASHNALRDLVIRTGEGAANILIDGALAGSIQGGRGGVNINIGQGASRDMLGISSIHNSVGRVSVTAADMLATASDKGLAGNAGFDDVKAAVISIRGGEVYVQNLLSSQDWDGANHFKWIGASIAMTGEGADYVNFFSMADGTSITTGAGDDTVRVMRLSNRTVLGADSDNDGRGAVLDLGTGVDNLSFEDLESLESTSTVIVGRNALVLGADRVFVEAFDRVVVTTLSTAADTALAFVGTRFLELEIENQTKGANDDDDRDGSIEVDLQRFDAALELVMMRSHETHDMLFDESGHYYYIPGAPTAFTLHNVRLSTELMLGAEDVTTHLMTPMGVFINDTLLAIDRQTGVVTANAEARDLSLWLSYAGARGLNDSASLQISAIDLDLTLAPTSTDTVGNAAPSDDDSMTIEHFTLNIGSGSSSIDFNGFGDVAHRASRAPVQSADVSSPVETSLAVIGVGLDTVFIDNVNADTITLNNGVSTHDNEGAMVLRVDAPNNYRIRTISGNDILDLRADTVRADDGESAVDRADYIDAGRGFDTLIISGDNHLGSSNLQRTAKATTFDDNVFMTLAGIEEIVIDTDHGSKGTTQQLTLDDAAANKGLERLRFTGSDTHTLHTVIGENYSYVTPSNAAQTLHIDASAHQGDFNLVLDSNARPGDVPKFNLAIHLRAAGESAVNGDSLLILDSGDEAQSLDLTLTTASRNVDTQLFEGVASGAGHVALTVTRGSIDSITLVDGGAENAAGIETTSDTYLISSEWTRDRGQFRFDASAIADTDNNTATGGLVISAKLSDAQMNTLLGSQNQDVLTGSGHSDMITGGGGNDIIDGGAGIDTAIFRGNRSNYTITTTASGFLIGGGADGVDTLINIERAMFDDQTIDLTEPDTTPPSTFSFSPANGATGVAVDGAIALTFSEAITRGTGTILLMTTAGALIESFNVATSTGLHITGSTLVLTPSAHLSPGTGYRLDIPGGSIKDLAGNAFAGFNAYSFTTGTRDTVITGTSQADILTGTAGDDSIDGRAGNDLLLGGPGNDLLIGGAGDDTLDGEAGIDRAVFSGNRANYQITSVDATSRIVKALAGNDGEDVLHDVERLSFKDTSVAFDLDGSAGIVAKTIGAVYGAPLVMDKRIVGIGLSFADQGMDYEALMTLAIDDRLQQNTSADRVVELLYTNVVGVPPDNASKAQFVALLEQGTYTIGELGMLAADDAFNTNRIGLVGLAQAGLEFLPHDA